MSRLTGQTAFFVLLYGGGKNLKEVLLARLLDESLLTNIALGFASSVFATRLLSKAAFYTTDGSASSNTYTRTSHKCYDIPNKVAIS